MQSLPVTINHRNIKEAIRIRRVEEKFLELFSAGKLNGTVHTCVGQEFSAVAFAGQLKKRDFIFSNHRCHGHYIAFTGDVRGLLANCWVKLQAYQVVLVAASIYAIKIFIPTVYKEVSFPLQRVTRLGTN